MLYADDPGNTRYNSRSLLRRATPLAVEPLDDALATTHALLRRATTISAKKICVISLQLTLSCGERPQMCALWQALWVLQLTLSCGERPFIIVFRRYPSLAPTHALLRRATVTIMTRAFFNDAPTHALLRRATVLFSSAAGVPTRYNSRSPAESDFAFRHLLPAL